MSGSNEQDDGNQPELDALIPLSKAAKMSGLSVSQLRLLVSRKEIWGVKPGRNWYTTEIAVREYLARDIRPGPKPKNKPPADLESN